MDSPEPNSQNAGMIDRNRKTDTLSAAILGGFTATAAMWAAGYVARLPAVMAPEPVLFGFLVLFLFGGGFHAGRDTGRVFPGAAAGFVAAVVNLLILGSVLGETTDRAALAYQLPGFLLLGTVLGAAGGFLGARTPRQLDDPNRVGRFARISVVVTLLLVIAGGVVTTKGAGMDVPDWPQSFGTNMFLFPLERMTGGIYYEHAHRLFGTLVGLTTLVLLVWLSVTERRTWVKVFAGSIFALVVVQGVLGGLRVTDASVALAAVHGVVGQGILALLAALAAFVSTTFRTAPAPVPSPRIGTDRKMGVVLAVLLLVQIALGSVLRHYDKLLHPHITVAVIVVGLGVVAGFRAWGIHADHAALRKTGVALLVLVLFQLVLGFAALGLRGDPHAARSAIATLFITAHQATGALLLAATALHLVWTRRLLAPAAE